MIAMTGARATAMTETRARDTETTTRVIKGAIGAASIATTTMTTKEGKTKGKEKGKGSIATTTKITARIEGTTATAATTDVTAMTGVSVATPPSCVNRSVRSPSHSVFSANNRSARLAV